MKKKILSILLAALMVVSLLPTVALAANVTSIAVTFDTAKAKDGDTLTQLQGYVGLVGENVELQSVDAISHNQSSPGPIASDGTISSSTEYHVRLVFKTTDSSKFDNGTTVTFNSSSIDRTDSSIPGYTIGNESTVPGYDFDIVTDGEGDYLIINTGAFTPVEVPKHPETDHGDWTAISDETGLNDLFTNGGNGYLTTEITMTNSATVAEGKTVNLCLNGQIINFNNQDKHISVRGSLNLYDCDNTEHYGYIDSSTHLWVSDTTRQDNNISIFGGSITGSTFAGVSVEGGSFTMNGGNIVGNCTGVDMYDALSDSPKNPSFTMNGGTITGNNDRGVYVATREYYHSIAFVMNGGTISNNYTDSDGGGVYVGEDSIFTMNNGAVISENISTKTNGSGGGVCNDGTFTMNGGNITNNSVSGEGGGVKNDHGTFIMNDGLISENTAGLYAGGFANANIMKMSGGTITNNSAPLVGGGCHYGQTFTIGGTAQIKGNKQAGKENNICLINGCTINLGTGETDSIAKPASGFSVGVTVLNSSFNPTVGKFTTNGTATDVDYFFSDSAEYYVNFVDDATDYLELKAPETGHLINFAACEYGSVKAQVNSVEVTSAEQNNEVTIVAAPDSGYELDTLTVTDADGGTVSVTDNKFTMPDKAVTVTATFKVNGEEPEGDCTYDRTVKLADNLTCNLKLNCCDKGEFTFEASGTGWNIKNSEGNYLNAENGKLVLGATATTAWTYKNGAFSTSVKTTQKNNGYWLGFLYIPGRGTKTVTTTYYLNRVDAGSLSTYYVGAELFEEVSGEHSYKYVNKCNGTHDKICKNCGAKTNETCVYDQEGSKCVCGAFDPAKAAVKISVDVNKKTTKQYVGWGWYGSWKDVTTYTATIKTEATGVKVCKVEYQLNGSSKWIPGTIVCSDKRINSLKVRALGSNGEWYDYEYPEAITVTTVGELMALNPDFPNSYDNGWVNSGETGKKMYYDNAECALVVSPGEHGNIFAQSAWSLEPVSGGYKAEYNSGTITTTFYVNGTEITSIAVTSTCYPSDFHGTYSPASN